METGGAAAAAIEDEVSFLSDTSAKVYVAGHLGLVGSAVVRRLRSLGFTNLLLRSRSELDLCRQPDVESFLSLELPRYVVVCAAKVGGIHANSTFPADFISVNLQIQTNLIDASFRCGSVRKLLFLGSSCIYPKHSPQPIPESALLTSPLEPTNQWYAVAKIAGIKMCQAYKIQHAFDAVSAMPTNLYGPNDNFHPENSHVLPALLRRFHEAKAAGAHRVVVWGTGSPLREFLHVDDLADAVVFLMDTYSGLEHVNVGSGEEVSIRDLAELVKEVVGFQGELAWDPTKPDGTPRKLMDSSKLAALGWRPRIPLREGLASTYRWTLWMDHRARLRDCKGNRSLQQVNGPVLASCAFQLQTSCVIFACIPSFLSFLGGANWWLFLPWMDLCWSFTHYSLDDRTLRPLSRYLLFLTFCCSTNGCWRSYYASDRVRC